MAKDSAAAPADKTDDRTDAEKTQPETDQPTALEAFDEAIEALTDAPLLHKGECAEACLQALKLVLVDLYQRTAADG